MSGLENGIINVELSDADFAARLIRIPPDLQKGGKTADARFNEAMQKAIGNDLGRSSQAGGKNGRHDKKLMDACVEMESLFVSKMLKEMRNTVHKTGWINGGFAEEIFQDMLYDEYALSLSKNSSLGISKMLYDELKRKL
jgi:Rod binding domain-containing protein